MNNKNTEQLIDAFLALENRAEAWQFLRDLLTEKEIEEFGNRWKAAQMLNKKISYVQIEQSTGLSSATIARIAKWLKNGMGGYQVMLQKLHHTSENPSCEKGVC